jgi:Tol biopolymer transport system component
VRKRIWLLLLFLFFLPLLACGGTKALGLLVYVASGEDGIPTSEVVVADPDGTELRRIPLPEAPLYLLPTRAKHIALAWLPNDRVFWLDAEASTAQELAVEGDVTSMVGRVFGGWRRYAVLASPRGDAAYLVNLETGETTDLIGLDDDFRMAFSGQFSPDERYLVIIGQDVWLLPTADPAKVRRVGGQDPGFGVAFSGDSQRIVYTARADEKFTVVVEAADGSKSEEVLSADDFVVALGFAPGEKSKIVVGREGSTTLLDLGSGQERELLAHEGLARRLFLYPDGQKMLLVTTESSEDVYFLIDPGTGKVKSLDDLRGYGSATFSENPDARWLYFIDSPGVGQGRRVASLDLRTGDTREVLALDEGSGLYPPLRSASSPDSRLALATVLVQDNKAMQLWLLDAQTGEARMLAEGTGVNGAISPDNRWIACGVWTRDGDAQRAELSLIPATGGEAKSLGPGSRPIWLYP